MSATATHPRMLAATGEQRESERRTGLKRTLRSLLRDRVAVLGILILLIMTVAAVFAPAIAPYDPEWQERSDRLVAPLSHGEDSGNFYLLGTDPLGRDILSRIVYGARVSMLIGFLSVALAAPVGVVLGLLAGYSNRWVDDGIMRLGDIQLAFPFILLAMVIVSVLGPSIRNLILVLAISGWVIYARVVRGQVIRLKEMEFVQAATASGCSSWRILFRHLMPNALTPVIVLVTFGLASMILLESSLSFLGLGVQPPTPSWGGMLNESRNYISQAWWVSVMPGVAIMVTVLSVNFLGDWLRDILDPKEQMK
jgi:peptide/nickel transport system permease protein